MTPPFNPDRPLLESAKRSIEVDMSPAAIDRRLRDVFALWEFWRFLKKFRPVERPAEGAKPTETAT